MTGRHSTTVLLIAFAVSALLSSCKRSPSETEAAQRATGVMRGAFGIQYGKTWTNVHAMVIEYHAILDGGSDNTRYLLVQEGRSDSADELLRDLKTNSVST